MEIDDDDEENAGIRDKRSLLSLDMELNRRLREFRAYLRRRHHRHGQQRKLRTIPFYH